MVLKLEEILVVGVVGERRPPHGGARAGLLRGSDVREAGVRRVLLGDLRARRQILKPIQHLYNTLLIYVGWLKLPRLQSYRWNSKNQFSRNENNQLLILE